MFNVKDFGAIGNGIADDRESIQNVIDACSATGGDVFFPVVTYLVKDDRNNAGNRTFGRLIPRNHLTE